MEQVRIMHVLQDGSSVTSMKDVNISAEQLSLAVKKAIYEIVVAAP